MKKNWIKYTIAFLLTLGIRLIPFRAPNIEPIMAIQMPFAKKYDFLGAFFFGFVSIVIYDLFTSGIGLWTFVTAVVYGIVGIFAVWFFKSKKSSRLNYVKFALIATIAYDALTGLTMGPLFFGQTFMVSLIGQIPFTALHLLGNVSFAFFLSPVIEKWIVKKEIFSFDKIKLAYEKQ